MKTQIIFFLTLSSIIGTTITQAACLDENERKQASRPNQTLPFEKWSQNDLIELASLFKEQDYYVGLFEIMLNNAPSEKYSPCVQHFAQKIGDIAKQQLDQNNITSQFGSLSDEKKLLGYKIYYGLLHLRIRFKDQNKYDNLVAILNKYDDSNLKTLREFTAILHYHRDLLRGTNSPSASQILENPAIFFPTFIQLAAGIQKILADHSKKSPSQTDRFVNIMSTLMLQRSDDELKNMKNIFSGEPFLMQVNIFSAPSPASSQPVITANPVAPVAMPLLDDDDDKCACGADEKTVIDLKKMSIDQLHKLASLLYEQSNCITLFDAMAGKSSQQKASDNTEQHPFDHLETDLKKKCLQIINTSASTIAKRRRNDPKYAQNENSLDGASTILYNAFCLTFGMQTNAKQLAEECSQYKLPALKPLEKMILLFDWLTSIFGPMSLGHDVTHNTDSQKTRLKDTAPIIRKIVKQHDLIFEKLKQLYADVINQLKARSRGNITKMRTSIFSKELMPATYSNRHPIIDPQLQEQSMQRTTPKSAPAQHEITPSANPQPAPAANDEKLSLGLGKLFAKEKYVFPPYATKKH